MSVEVTMMRDCLGGDRIVEVRLPRGVELADLDRLPDVSSRVVLEHLPRPFYRLDVPGRYSVSGIVSDARVRFTVRLAAREQAEALALDACRHLQP